MASKQDLLLPIIHNKHTMDTAYGYYANSHVLVHLYTGTQIIYTNTVFYYF